MIRRLTRAIGCATASETGFTLVELIVTMSLMLVVLTAVSATFASGTHSETSASNRIRAESDARQALTTMRDDLHCSFAITSVTQNALGGFTLTMTEFYNTCKAVDQNSTSGSKVLLSWCTIPSPSNPNVFNLYRENTTCDTTGTRVVASDIVAPATGWPQNTAATGVGGSGSPTSWNGNIWPTSPTCQLGYLQTQVVDVAVNPNYTKDPTSKYELKNTIALRNSTRCGTGTGTLAGPSLTLTVPSSSPKDTAINPSATVSGSSSETSPITFFYWKQPTAPTDCTTGGTTVGTANPAGDGTYPSSLSYTPTTAGDHIWWYATMSADSNNVAVASACGAGMPTTTVTLAPVTPTLTVTAPGSASTGVAIAPTAIAGLLSGSSGATTGLITFYVIAQASAPAAGTCPTGMTTVGTASPTGDGTWNPSAGYTPASATTLWWYAKFAGDAGDNPASSPCGPLTGMSSTTVKTGQTISFTSTAPTAAKVNGSTYTATATATSGLAVTFSSATPSVCTASGAVFTFIAEGTCTVNANQAGNGTYNPAPQVQQSFTVYSLMPTNLTIANGSGTSHKADANDTIKIVFNHAIQQSSVCSTWTLVSQTITGVTVTMNGGNGGNKNDLSFTGGTVSGAGACAGGNVKIGTMASNTNVYKNSSGSITFAGSTIAWDPVTFTMTITLAGGPAPGTAVAANTYTYTPNAAIALASNPAVTISGTAAVTAINF